MLKRKPSQQLEDRPHALAPILERDPTQRQRKRLFRPKNQNKHVWQPANERAMSELLEFVLKHEEAFQK
jgi:charged multivesicular body protein 7